MPNFSTPIFAVAQGLLPPRFLQQTIMDEFVKPKRVPVR